MIGVKFSTIWQAPAYSSRSILPSRRGEISPEEKLVMMGEAFGTNSLDSIHESSGIVDGGNSIAFARTASMISDLRSVHSISLRLADCVMASQHVKARSAASASTKHTSNRPGFVILAT